MAKQTKESMKELERKLEGLGYGSFQVSNKSHSLVQALASEISDLRRSEGAVTLQKALLKELEEIKSENRALHQKNSDLYLSLNRSESRLVALEAESLQKESQLKTDLGSLTLKMQSSSSLALFDTNQLTDLLQIHGLAKSFKDSQNFDLVKLVRVALERFGGSGYSSKHFEIERSLQEVELKKISLENKIFELEASNKILQDSLKSSEKEIARVSKLFSDSSVSLSKSKIGQFQLSQSSKRIGCTACKSCNHGDQQEHQTLKLRIKVIDSERERAVRLLEEANQRIEAYKLKIIHNDIIHRDIQSKLRLYSHENFDSSLRSLVDQKNQIIASLERQLASYNSDTLNQKTYIHTVQKLNVDYSEKYESQKNLYNTLYAEKVQLELNFIELKKAFTSLEMLVEKKETIIRELKNSNIKIQEKYETFSGQYSEIHKEKSELIVKVSSLEHSLLELKSQIEFKSQEIVRLNTQIHEYRSRSDVFYSAQNELLQLKEEISLKESEIKVLSQEKHHFSSEIASLQNKISKYSVEIREERELRLKRESEIESMNIQISKLSNEISTYVSEIRIHKEHSSQKHVCFSEFESIKHKYSELIKERTTLESRIHEINEEHSRRYSSLMEEYSRKESSFRSEIHELSQTLISYKSKLTEKEASFIHINQTIATLTEKLSIKEKEYHNLYSCLSSEKKVLETQLHEMTVSMQSYREKYTHLQSSSQKASESVTHLESYNTSLKHELNEKIQLVSSLHSTIESLKEKLIEIEKSVQVIRYEKDVLRNELHEKYHEIKIITEQYEQASSRLIKWKHEESISTNKTTELMNSITECTISHTNLR